MTSCQPDFYITEKFKFLSEIEKNNHDFKCVYLCSLKYVYCTFTNKIIAFSTEMLLYVVCV